MIGRRKKEFIMLKAYINYPNPHVTVHYDPECGNIQAQHKPKQRYIRINLETISEELKSFHDQKYTFAATQERNDMWLEIEFHNHAFELAVLEYICGMLGQHYKPLQGLKPETHCEMS
jgi:ATP-dependent exoDNAse (exonuclease V) beta subunit